MRASTKLNLENYDFEVIGTEMVADRPAYVLETHPKRKEKYLFRGRIWVDAEDYALMRAEGSPAKNPSFWIKRTDIRQAYLKVGDFWLPKENTSVSIIRLGGRATLTIEYQNYEILGAHPLPETDAGRAPHLAVSER